MKKLIAIVILALLLALPVAAKSVTKHPSGPAPRQTSTPTVTPLPTPPPPPMPPLPTFPPGLVLSTPFPVEMYPTTVDGCTPGFICATLTPPGYPGP